MPVKLSTIIIAVLLVVSCTPKKGGTTAEADQGSPSQWAQLGDILDHYDESAKITADFIHDVFVDGTVQETSSGRHEYSRGEEKWFYLKDGELQRTVECFVDKAVVRVPLDKQPRKKGKKRPKANDPDAEIVAVHEANYPCAMQALVRYHSQLKGNKLEHDGKVFVVNSFDVEKKVIRKISMHRDNRIQVYTFSNIQMHEFQPEAVPEEPAEDGQGQESATE